LKILYDLRTLLKQNRSQKVGKSFLTSDLSTAKDVCQQAFAAAGFSFQVTLPHQVLSLSMGMSIPRVPRQSAYSFFANRKLYAPKV
jgi:hypothetical protein